MSTNRYSIINLDLSTARNNERILISGEVLYILNIPSMVSGELRFDETQNDPLPLKKGLRYDTTFDRLYITNTAGSGTLTLIVSKDRKNFDFEEIGAISISDPVKLNGADNLDATSSPVNVTQAVTLIAAARSSRYMLTLYNEGDNPARIGKSDVTFANKGILLQPGASIIVNFTGAVYAICGGGLSTSISFIDEYGN